MGAAIGWLAAKSLFGSPIGEKLARVILTAALFLGVLGASAALVAAYNHHVITVNNQKIVRRAAPATNKAADERAQDAIRGAAQQREMHDVIQAQPDQPIAPTTRALSCERLRRAGRTPPACR